MNDKNFLVLLQNIKKEEIRQFDVSHNKIQSFGVKDEQVLSLMAQMQKCQQIDLSYNYLSALHFKMQSLIDRIATLQVLDCRQHSGWKGSMRRGNCLTFGLKFRC